MNRLIRFAVLPLIATLMLAGCSATSVLPDTPLAELLPTRSEVAGAMGPEWTEVSDPQPLPLVNMTAPIDADELGASCVDASAAINDEFDEEHTSILEATGVASPVNDFDAATWALFRMKSADAATSYLASFKTWVKACAEDSPGPKNVVPIKDIEDSFAVEVLVEDVGVSAQVYVVRGDLVIWTVSPESARVAADMAQLQLDKIAEIQKG